MTPALANILLRSPFSPDQLPGMAARYDASDITSMRNNAGTIPSSGDGIKLWADKSGNSAVNCLVLNGSSTNYASFTALTAFGTGDFSVSFKIQVNQIAGGNRIFSGANNALDLFVNTNGTLLSGLAGVGSNTASTGTIAAFQTCVVTYVRSGTTGTYYIDGVSAGTTSDSRNYSVGQTVMGIFPASATSNPFNGIYFWGHAYTRALSGAEVIADATGVIQVGSVILNVDFGLFAKLAASASATTGGTVTINTSGDTGARICGARDYGVMTSGKQGLWSAALRSITTDGVDDFFRTPAFPLAQGWTRYTVLRQKAWTIGAYLMDGASAANSGALIQTTTTPQLNINAGSSVAANTGAAVGAFVVITEVFNGAGSLLRVNRTAPITGNAGAASANGLTLGASGASTAASFGNGEFCEQVAYASVHDEGTQNRFIDWALRKWIYPL